MRLTTLAVIVNVHVRTLHRWKKRLPYTISGEKYGVTTAYNNDQILDIIRVAPISEREKTLLFRKLKAYESQVDEDFKKVTERRLSKCLAQRQAIDDEILRLEQRLIRLNKGAVNEDDI